MSYEAWGEPDDSPFDAAIEAGWINPLDQSKALIDVMNERDRQVNEEKFTAEHDDKYITGTLAKAAVCYALHGLSPRLESIIWTLWPWDLQWFKPTQRRRNLVKAAALLLADIEAIDRAAAKAVQP